MTGVTRKLQARPKWHRFTGVRHGWPWTAVVLRAMLLEIVIGITRVANL